MGTNVLEAGLESFRSVSALPGHRFVDFVTVGNELCVQLAADGGRIAGVVAYDCWGRARQWELPRGGLHY